MVQVSVHFLFPHGSPFPVLSQFCALQEGNFHQALAVFNMLRQLNLKTGAGVTAARRGQAKAKALSV